MAMEMQPVHKDAQKAPSKKAKARKSKVEYTEAQAARRGLTNLPVEDQARWLAENYEASTKASFVEQAGLSGK